ncbi:hypothetical protein, partial [Leuconostoc mesenteroides]|uniref:hypothetical protein n=1 Tax=Leuconostoc mesenteroides TaxID=1245 RepID=UPI001CBD6AD1
IGKEMNGGGWKRSVGKCDGGKGENVELGGEGERKKGHVCCKSEEEERSEERDKVLEDVYKMHILFFQAEGGILVQPPSRELGDEYKGQGLSYQEMGEVTPVSYSHLKLPTIERCSSRGSFSL